MSDAAGSTKALTADIRSLPPETVTATSAKQIAAQANLGSPSVPSAPAAALLCARFPVPKEASTQKMQNAAASRFFPSDKSRPAAPWPASPRMAMQTSAYRSPAPKKEQIHIQKMLPAPPAAMPIATPAMLPTPTVPPSDTAAARKDSRPPLRNMPPTVPLNTEHIARGRKKRERAVK